MFESWVDASSQVSVITTISNISRFMRISSSLLSTLLAFTCTSVAQGLRDCQMGLRDCQMYMYDRVYFIGGVNNLSTRVNGMSTPKYDNKDQLVRDIMQELYRARVKIDPLANEVVICDMIGMNFQNYNYGWISHAYIAQQRILDSAIIRINEYIQEMNTDRGLNSPQIGDVVRKKRGSNRMEHKYLSTCHDGLYFNEVTAVKIMDKLMINMFY